jgi:hypothetical protein
MHQARMVEPARVAPGARSPDVPAPGILSAQELLAGSAMVHEVAIPADVLRPPSTPSDGDGADAGRVRIRPMRVATLALIARAAKDDPTLVPLLMIKDAMVEPALELEQIRQLHAGLVHFLVERINRISGLVSLDDAREGAATAYGRTHLLLARHFGWTPQQVAELTPGQVAVYLAGVQRLHEMDAAEGPVR